MRSGRYQLPAAEKPPAGDALPAGGFFTKGVFMAIPNPKETAVSEEEKRKAAAKKLAQVLARAGLGTTSIGIRGGSILLGSVKTETAR